MSAKVSQRQVQDILVLEIAERLTLGDACKRYRDAIRAALDAGHRKLLVDLRDVQYIDSSGLGEIVSSCMSVAKAGGVIRFSGLTDRLRDLFQMARLYTLFTPLPALDDNVAEWFDVGPVWRCPICGAGLYGTSKRDNEQECAGCGGNIHTAAESSALRVVAVSLSSYKDEVIRLDYEVPTTLRVIGRLNSFSCRGLSRLLGRIPQPRCVLIEIDDRAELESVGRTALLEVLGPADGPDRVALFMNSPRELAEFPHWRQVKGVYTVRQAALDHLGELVIPPARYLERYPT